MSEKYEGLLENIENDDTFDMTRSELVGARVALQWLDQNRDQAPGRTITESGWIEACKATMGGDMVAPFALATRLGITVVPDPNPTNFDRLEDLVDQWRKGPQGKTLTQYLDEHGVKAPGGDDD